MKKSKHVILLPVNFLTSRCQNPNIDDLAKLRRVLGYLLATRDEGLILRIGEAGVRVRAYIDAAFGVHPATGKSQTGCCVIVGEAGPVYVKSGKQKIVTRSSTEAELVALSDCGSQGLHLRNFLGAQGYE